MMAGINTEFTGLMLRGCVSGRNEAPRALMASKTGRRHLSSGMHDIHDHAR